MRTAYSARDGLALATLVILLLSGLSLVASRVHAAPNTITRTLSGLVAADSLTTEDTSYWTFGNSGPGVGTYSSSEDSAGLHIGAQSALMGAWVFNGAASPGTPAALFHAYVTRSTPALTTDGQTNTGIYV